MQTINEIIQFAGSDRTVHVGILSSPAPDQPRRNVLLVLSHGGLVHKVGAYRAHRRLADYFVSRGCSVFRFDPLAMGDADGCLGAIDSRDLFAKIESGMMVAGYDAAFKCLEGRFRDHSWIVSGVCGGAVSSLLAGAQASSRVAGCALISCPVVLDGSGFDYSRRVSLPMAARSMRVYLLKLLSLRAIARFLAGRSDYTYLAKNTRGLWFGAWDSLRRRMGLSDRRRSPASTDAESKPPLGLNLRFVEAVNKLKGRTHLLFVYGDNDGFLTEFDNLFAGSYLAESERTQMRRVIGRANHMFTWPEWQDEAFAIIDRWIDEVVLASPRTRSRARLR